MKILSEVEILCQEPKFTMGDLPNDVRTALVKSEAKETELLASLLLNKRESETISNLSYFSN